MPRSEVVTDGDLVIRRMRDSEADYRLIVRWRNLPHVRRYWDPDLPPTTLASAIEELRPDLAPDAASTPCIVELEGRPIGYVQFYRWASYADDAEDVGIPFDDRTYGLDIFIGEPELVGKGIGTRVVDILAGYLIGELGAGVVALTTDVTNHAAQRCYEKAGFHKVRRVLDTDTYEGRRVWAWVMIRPASTPAPPAPGPTRIEPPDGG